MLYFDCKKEFENFNWKNYIALVMQNHKPNHLKYLKDESL